MQPITVAITDENGERCAKFEHLLQAEQGIKVLANVRTNEVDRTRERRFTPRANITAIEDMVAKVRRLNPRILLANLKQCTDADCAMLVSLRRECPETLVVMLADESDQQEDQVMQALAKGARGYLDIKSAPAYISKAVYVIDRGEAWVPRKMLGKMMDQVLQWCHGNPIEAHFDPAC